MDFQCAICGSRQAQTRLKLSEYQIVRCRRCTTLRLWPLPSPETLQLFYNHGYYTRHLNTWFSRLFMRFFHLYEVKRVKFLQTLQPSGRFLDVGCGAGELLADMAARGYEVYGTEISSAAWPSIPAVLRPRVKTDELDQCHFPENSFNLIMLSDVLEHTYYPLKTLSTVASLLRPDGHVIISVPNWFDPDARIFHRKYWHNLDVPVHLWHFTSSTLVQLSERAGLRMVGTMRLGWIELFEAPLSLVHAWEKWLRAAGVKPIPTRILTWLGALFLIPTTILIRQFGRQPRQLRFIFSKA